MKPSHVCKHPLQNIIAVQLVSLRFRVVDACPQMLNMDVTMNIDPK